MKKSFLLLSLILLLYVTAFAESQDAVLVSYLGPEGTYTEEAAQFWFKNGETLIPKTTVNDAIEDMLTGAADFAVIPQENTVGGAVINYVDALIKSENAYVVGEVVLPISQTLMGVPGTRLENIKTVCSHTQGLTQSAQWRAEYLPDAVTEEMSSTAAAASYVAEQQDKSIAAVATRTVPTSTECSFISFYVSDHFENSQKRNYSAAAHINIAIAAKNTPIELFTKPSKSEKLPGFQNIFFDYFYPLQIVGDRSMLISLVALINLPRRLYSKSNRIRNMPCISAYPYDLWFRMDIPVLFLKP